MKTVRAIHNTKLLEELTTAYSGMCQPVSYAIIPFSAFDTAHACLVENQWRGVVLTEDKLPTLGEVARKVWTDSEGNAFQGPFFWDKTAEAVLAAYKSGKYRT